MNFGNAALGGALTAAEAEIITNLLQTPAGTCGMHRDFGLDWSFLDLQTESAKAAYTAEVVAKIEKFLPALRVSEVAFTVDGGTLRPKVVVCRA